MAGWEKQTNQVPKCLILAVGNLGLSWKRKTFFLLSAGPIFYGQVAVVGCINVCLFITF